MDVVGTKKKIAAMRPSSSAYSAGGLICHKSRSLAISNEVTYVPHSRSQQRTDQRVLVLTLKF